MQSATQTSPVEPAVAFAPGRVNLLGEHTDTTGGLVLPLAIDRGTRVRVRARTDGELVVRSTARPQPFQARIAALAPDPGSWASYVAGVVASFPARGALAGGLEVEVEGDVPEGAGLSSSASLTVACARAIDRHLSAGLDAMALAQLCRRVEHEYCGVRCGLMDQAAAALLEPGEALFLDCHRLEWRRVTLPRAAVAIVHSGVSHSLVASGYNRRLEECAEILRHLPELDHLGAVAESDLPALAERVPAELFPRLEHVATENARVRAGLVALERHDLPGFGALMHASHVSLRDRYEVSCPELDVLVERLGPLAYGAKMTGAGFGGAVVALLPPVNLPRLRTSFGSALVHAFEVGNGARS